MIDADDMPNELRAEIHEQSRNYTAPIDSELSARVAIDVARVADAAQAALDAGEYTSAGYAVWQVASDVLDGHQYFARSWYGPTTYGRLLELYETVCDTPDDADPDADELVRENGRLKEAAADAYEFVVCHYARQLLDQRDD